jgi:hypothetical protein
LHRRGERDLDRLLGGVDVTEDADQDGVDGQRERPPLAPPLRRGAARLKRR